MKLPITSIINISKIPARTNFTNNSGFLIVEIMIAFSLFTLFTISTFTLISSIQNLKIWSSRELIKLKDSAYIMDNFIRNRIFLPDIHIFMYGNDSFLIQNEPFTITYSDLLNAWGGNNCSPRIHFNPARMEYFSQGINLGVGNVSTDLEVRNNIVYLTANSATVSKPDFYIIDAKNASNPIIMASINTGPGLNALEIAGPYVYVANAGTTAQLQIIDIHNRNAPTLISQFKLPLPEASTSPPIGTSIFYNKGFVYLGTTKWNGQEFSIIDVNDPRAPYLVGSFETNTLINDIFFRENRAYIATSDIGQMRVLDISDKSSPQLLFSFSPSGWQTQEGKILDFFENSLGLGRTVGGFNVKTNHEAFIFAKSSIFTDYSSQDIPGGIYGMLLRQPNVFLLTHSLLHEFQVWDFNMKNKIFDLSLGTMPVKMICDWSTLFFATGDQKAISILKL